MALTEFAFDPVTGFNDTTAFPNPTSGSQARTQLQTPLNQLKTYINEDLKTEVDAKATVASPTFTGTPKAPTASTGTNNTQLATTAFVKDAIDNIPKLLIKRSYTGTSKTLTAGGTNYWKATIAEYSGYRPVFAMVDSTGDYGIMNCYCHFTSTTEIELRFYNATASSKTITPTFHVYWFLTAYLNNVS